MNKLYALEDKYSKYSFLVIVPTGIAMFACAGTPKLVEIFGLITLVLGHILLGIKLGRRRAAGEKRAVFNLVFWEVAVLGIILGFVLVFGWKEVAAGWVTFGIGVLGLVLGLLIRPLPGTSGQAAPGAE